MSNIINKALLAKYSPLPINYDYSEIMNYVPVAQAIWVRSLIGDELMDELEDQVEHNNLTPENQALMTEGMLLQYLAYATCLEGLPFIFAHFSEVGVTKSKSDVSESVSLKDLSYIETHLRKQVEFLKETVKKYICEHNDVFVSADFCACGCSCCNQGKPLSTPNPNYMLYSPFRRNTNLK